jgi:hypothetical protein
MSREDLESKYLIKLAERDMQAWRRHVRETQSGIGCGDEESKRAPSPYVHVAEGDGSASERSLSPYDPDNSYSVGRL